MKHKGEIIIGAGSAEDGLFTFSRVKHVSVVPFLFSESVCPESDSTLSTNHLQRIPLSVQTDHVIVDEEMISIVC